MVAPRFKVTQKRGGPDGYRREATTHPVAPNYELSVHKKNPKGGGVGGGGGGGWGGGGYRRLGFRCPRTLSKKRLGLTARLPQQTAKSPIPVNYVQGGEKRRRARSFGGSEKIGGEIPNCGTPGECGKRKTGERGGSRTVRSQDTGPGTGPNEKVKKIQGTTKVIDVPDVRTGRPIIPEPDYQQNR